MRLAASIFALLITASPAAAKFYEATHYDVKLQLGPQGTLTVAETIDFRFVAGPFTYVFRDLATTQTDGIDQVQASLDGRPCSTGTGPGQVEIEGTSPVKVRWHFPEIISGNHTFTLTYRVAGVIRPNGSGQLLSWRALPHKKDYTILSSEIALEYPQTIEPQSIQLRSHAPDFKLTPGRATAIVVHPNQDGEIIDAKFPARSFAAALPKWIGEQINQAIKARDQMQNATTGSLALMIVAWSSLFLLKSSVKPPPADLQTEITQPPDSLQPALAGMLASKPGLAMGVLLDLARRGIVRIQSPKPHEFEVIWCNPNAQLSPHEKVLHQLVFPTRDTVNLRDFVSRQGQIAAAVRAEAQSLGLLDQARTRVRMVLLIAGFICLIAGCAMLFLRLPHFLIMGGTAVSVGFIGLMAGATQTVWTDAGIISARRWKAYARHLAKAEAVPNLYEVLPYAATFGIAKALLKRHNMPLPPWFQAFSTADGADTTAFHTFIATSDASSSGSGSFDGGGGASGGGDSGAG